MNKKTFSNLLNKERSKYKASVPTFRNLNKSGLGISGDISSNSLANSSSPGRNTEIIKKLDAIETRQIGILKFLSSVDDRLTSIEKNLNNNAQSKMLLECQILVTKTQQSICRITGDMEDEEYLELSTELPMSSVELVRFIEGKPLKKGKRRSYGSFRLMVNAKGSKGSVDGVLRGLFSDDVMYHYNLEGCKNKHSLLGLRSVGFIFDIFPDKDKNSLCEELRRFVGLSHIDLSKGNTSLRWRYQGALSSG